MLSAQSHQANQAQLRELIEQLPMAAAMFDRHMRYLALSPRWLSDFGMTNKDVIGLSHYDLFPETPDHWREVHQKTLNGALEAREEEAFERSDGSIQWLRWETRPWNAHDGSGGGILVFLEDITQRKRLEHALLASQAEATRLNAQLRARVDELEALLNVVPMGIGVALDRECQTVRANPALARMLAISPDDNASKSAPDGERPQHFRILGPNGLELPECQLPMQRAARHGIEVVDSECHLVHADGHELYLWGHVIPLFDESGQPRGSVGAFMDITEQKQARERQSFLLALDDATRRLTDPEEIARTVSRFLSEFLRVDSTSISPIDDRAERGIVSGLGDCDLPGVYGEELMCALRAGQLYIESDINRASLGPAERARYAASQIGAMVAVPLRQNNRVAAIFAVSHSTMRTWSQAEVNLIRQVANRYWESVERAQAVLALRKSEQRLQFVMNHAPIALMVHTPEGRVIEVNKAFTDQTGYALHEIPTARDWLLKGRRIPEANLETVQAHISSDESDTLGGILGTTVWTKSGQRRDWLVHRSGMIQFGDDDVFNISLAADITALRTAEEALRQSKSDFETLANHVPQMVWMCTPDGLNFYFNQRWVQYTGLTLEESYGTGWIKPFHIEDQVLAADAWSRATQTGSTYTVESRICAVDGSFRWFLMKGEPLRDPDGRVVRWFGTCTDIHDLKMAESAARASEARLRALAETVPDILYATDASGRNEYVSNSYVEYTGIQEGNLFGDGWLDIVHPDDQRKARAHWTRAVTEQAPYQMELRLRRHDGVYRWFLSRAKPLRDDAGRIVKWFGAASDIEEQKQTEYALRIANDDLQQFAYAAAHDFREPLRNVRAFSELLVRNYAQIADEKLPRIKDTIIEGVQRMDDLLTDLLEYTRLASQNEPYNGHTLSHVAVQKALFNLDTAIQSSQARISFHQLPSIPGCEAHYVQLFQNLIGNAIKYRGPESPVITISAVKREGEWVFSVRDNGLGIDPKYATQIFGVFKRLHGRNIPGTGIGLAICQRIVARYGGRIWVESQPGKGAEFLFSIPFRPVGPPTRKPNDL